MFEFAHAWQGNRSEDCPYAFNVRVLVPDRLREHRVEGRAPDIIQQPGYAQAGGFACDCRQLVFDSSVGVVQLEDEPVTAWHIWRKVSVAGFDPGYISIGAQRLAYQIGRLQLLPKRNRESRLRLLRKILKPNGKNRWSLSHYAQCFAAGK